MHIVVIGAGVTGVTTAWYLRKAGHEVTVVERREGPALETSFANGGQVSLSHPEPWANPGAPLTILRWLGRRDAPMLFRLPAEPARWRWGMEFLRECLPGRSHRNTLAIGHLAAWSGRLLYDLNMELNLSYEQRDRGVLHLYFNNSDLQHGIKQANLIQNIGIGAKVLTAEQCVEYDPALASCMSRLTGGMLGDDDESGNCYLFTRQLADAAAKAGVTFRYGADIERLMPENGRITSLHLVDESGRRGAVTGDAYVVCAGSFSKTLARRASERLPIYPVKGYSATVPVRDASRAPTVSITDESHRIVLSRLGDALRIAGTAELNGFNLDLDANRCNALTQWVEDLFPGAADLRAPAFWAGLRPTTPSNLPIIGRSRLPNLFYNTGHGTLGYTLACGSAQLLANFIDGQPPQIRYPMWKGRR
ncbi:D-amino acid dehydrogenase [Viridibacterium curvum]|uniref:D-amino acid dehydrogenase n=1 Tax=Viridibacterium curvum TaxID=1101404 RepID=UPI0031ED5CD2